MLKKRSKREQKFGHRRALDEQPVCRYHDLWDIRSMKKKTMNSTLTLNLISDREIFEGKPSHIVKCLSGGHVLTCPARRAS